MLSFRNVVYHGSLDLFDAWRRPLSKLERYARGMSVQDHDSVAGRRDGNLLIYESSNTIVDCTQDLLRFTLHFVFFARNEWNNVLQDIKTCRHIIMTSCLSILSTRLG